MSLWVYNSGRAQLDGSSALSRAHSHAGDGWLLTDFGFPWGDSALPHLPVSFQQTKLFVPAKDRDAGDSKLKQAKPLQALLTSCLLASCWAKQVTWLTPESRSASGFPQWENTTLQNLVVKEGTLGSSLQSTILVIRHLGQVRCYRTSFAKHGMTKSRNDSYSEQSGVTRKHTEWKIFLTSSAQEKNNTGSKL